MTPSTIKAGKPGQTLRDDKVRGLQMRVFANRRSWYLWYRTRAGQERRPKLGDYPTISLDSAREIARGLLEVVAAGGDPMAKWQKQAGATVMATLCDRYLAWAEANKKETSLREDKRLVNKFIRRKFGSRSVEDITHAEIDDWLVRYKDTPYQANRLRACLSKMFRLAEKWEMRPKFSNPVRDTIKFREKKRKRYMTPTEAMAVYKALESYRDRYPQAVAFLYLLLFTGARPNEIANARAEWRKGNRLELPVHKTDGDGHDRIIFLPPQAVAILDSLPNTGGTITGIQSPMHVWKKIRKDTGIADLRIYDLRHSFASAALAAGVPLSQIGELLGHNSAETTKRYAHLIDELGTQQAAKAAGFIEGMLKSA